MFGHRRRSYVRGRFPGLMVLALVLALAVPGAAATTALASTAGAAQNAGATAADLPCNTAALRRRSRCPTSASAA